MAQLKVLVEGSRELERALGQLPKATGKNVLRRVLKKRAQPLADDMKSKAPDDRATPPGDPHDLKTSIAVSTKLNKRQRTLHRKMFRDDRASVEMFVGAGDYANVPHAHMVEFGSIHNVPEPYARPAWDGNKMAMLEGIKDDLWQEIEKSAKRLARKRVRQERQRLGLE